MASKTQTVDHEAALQKLHTPQHMKNRPTKAPGPLGECTILDLASGSAVALFGTPEGRLVVAVSASGPWEAKEFMTPTKAPGKQIMQEFVYRNSYDGARRVRILWDNTAKVWLAGGGEDTDPKSVGRVATDLNQEEFDNGLLEMAQKLVAESADSKALGDEVGKLLVATARHAFNRGWKEHGFGWL